MPTYNFKREVKLHLVHNNQRFSLDIYPDYSFSQTFDESNLQVKTLHQRYHMFDEALIVKANPANFSFTCPILLQTDMNILFKLLTEWDFTSTEAALKTFDLYFESNTETYVLEKCVFENGVFQIVKDSVLLLNLSGTARKLSTYTGAIPGTLQTRSPNRTYTVPTSVNITLGGVVQPHISAVTVELKNEVRWLDNTTVHQSLKVRNASETQFPEAFVVSGRVISGTIQQYVTEVTANINTWSTTSSANIKVGNLGSSNTLEINLPNIVFTNRIMVEDVFQQSYDFRMTNNPINLTSIIIKNNI